MRRRFGADVLLAVVLPVACALALLLLQPDRDQPEGQPPVETPLTSASVVCPAPLPGTGVGPLGVSTLGADPGVAGRRARCRSASATRSTPLRVRTGRVSHRAARHRSRGGDRHRRPRTRAGRGTLADAHRCPPSTARRRCADQWFTAVGAGATHDSVVELVNPNAGPAIADITVRSPTGVVDVPALRGVSVPGGTSTSARPRPDRAAPGELSLEVHTSRGRLAVHVVDAYDELGTGTSGQDWLPAQPEPATTNLLLGLTGGAGERTLVAGQPGRRRGAGHGQGGHPDVRRSRRPASSRSGSRPDSTAAVSLDDVLAQAAKDGATGLLVESTGPVDRRPAPGRSATTCPC